MGTSLSVPSVTIAYQHYRYSHFMEWKRVELVLVDVQL